jgi:hypothetical protein
VVAEDDAWVEEFQAAEEPGDGARGALGHLGMPCSLQNATAASTSGMSRPCDGVREHEVATGRQRRQILLEVFRAALWGAGQQTGSLTACTATSCRPPSWVRAATAEFRSTCSHARGRLQAGRTSLVSVKDAGRLLAVGVVAATRGTPVAVPHTDHHP